jgi:hypothetical protein
MPRVYEINWSGTFSNVVCFGITSFFVILIVVFTRIIVRAAKGRGSYHGRDSPWRGALAACATLLAFLSFAVIGGSAASSGGAGSGTLGAGTKSLSQTYASSVRRSERSWIAISLLAVPTLVTVLIVTVLFEPPLQISVSLHQITLLYRLPWRNTSIDVASITGVQLDRHEYFTQGIFHRHFYTLDISHRGIETVVHCGQSPWHEEQLQVAYENIRSQIGQKW